MSTSNLITQGYGPGAQHIITLGAYAPDPRVPLAEISNAFILQGLNSTCTQDIILRGFSSNFSIEYSNIILEFDSPLTIEMEFDSPIQTKDRIIRKYKMWI